MDKLKDGAFTGGTCESNPYQGDLGTGIDYDRYESTTPRIVQDGDFSRITASYRSLAVELVKHCSALFGQRILDLGSGTGISTLELLQQKQGVFAVGIEKSPGMLLLARYKFHQYAEQDLFAQAHIEGHSVDERLIQYWREFRAESEPYSGKVEFVLGNFEEADLAAESFDAAIGSQFMHWTELSKSFKQLARVLRGKEVVWSTASHFYNDSRFPAAEYGFRYNDFVAFVLEDVCSRGNLAAKDYRSISKPTHNLESIRTISREQGFETEQIATHLRPYDLQIFVRNHVPVLVRNLVTSEVDPAELEARVKDAVARAIVNPDALRDMKHKYDIVPFFRSVKR